MKDPLSYKTSTTPNLMKKEEGGGQQASRKQASKRFGKVKDAHCLRIFEESNKKGLLPEGSFPVTVDVTALYTNIPAEGDNGGLQAVEKALETRSDKTV